MGDAIVGARWVLPVAVDDRFWHGEVESVDVKKSVGVTLLCRRVV